MFGSLTLLLALVAAHLSGDGVAANKCQKYYGAITGRAPISLARDCDQLRDMGGGMDGVYMVFPDGAGNDCKSSPVYCDQTTDGGGWTVIQRRKYGKEEFERSWAEYREGFGYLHGEFWAGNDLIHRLTMQGTYELAITIEDFQGSVEKALYFPFAISDEATNYTLGLGPMISGSAGDSMAGHNGQPFSTYDRDNDAWTGNCAVEYTGAWWYKGCHTSNLNGKYFMGPNAPFAKGVVWSTWKGFDYSLFATEMKIKLRPGQVP